MKLERIGLKEEEISRDGEEGKAVVSEGQKSAASLDKSEQGTKVA